MITEAQLLADSHLPGPRANLELLYQFIEQGSPEDILRFAQVSPSDAPTNTPGEFLAACGTAGLGRLIAEGQTEYLPLLRSLACDPRWRVREAVAMALQRWGDARLDQMTDEAEDWAEGGLYEQRAAVAGLCEPRLLTSSEQAERVLRLLDQVTRGILRSSERGTEPFRVLRQALGYAWSVVVAALPEQGWPIFATWADCPDKDITWIVRENLKKNRLRKLGLTFEVNKGDALG